MTVKIQKTRSQYDPLEIARAEGKVYSSGLKGKYKKSLVTRLGFILIAILFLGGGFALLFSSISNFLAGENLLAVIITFYMGAGCTIVGLLLLKRVMARKSLE